MGNNFAPLGELKMKIQNLSYKSITLWFFGAVSTLPIGERILSNFKYIFLYRISKMQKYKSFKMQL